MTDNIACGGTSGIKVCGRYAFSMLTGCRFVFLDITVFDDRIRYATPQNRRPPEIMHIHMRIHMVGVPRDCIDTIVRCPAGPVTIRPIALKIDIAQCDVTAIDVNAPAGRSRACDLDPVGDSTAFARSPLSVHLPVACLEGDATGKHSLAITVTVTPPGVRSMISRNGFLDIDTR